MKTTPHATHFRFALPFLAMLLLMLVGCGNSEDSSGPNPTPTTLPEAIKKIDLRKFPAMDGAQYVQNSYAGASFMLPKGDLNKAIEFYKTKLSELGFKPAADPKLFQTYPNVGGAQLTFVKDGYRLSLAMGTSPADGNLNATMHYIGNIDARKLPRFTRGECTDEWPARVIFKTDAKPDKVREFMRAELKKLGWLEFRDPPTKGMPDLTTAEFSQTKFMQQGMRIEMNSMPLEGKTQFYMAVQMLDEQLPLMPEAEGIIFQHDPLQLMYQVKTEPAKVLEFHRNEFKSLGWKERDGGKVGDVKTSLVYEAPEKEPVRFEYLKLKDDLTVVQIIKNPKEEKAEKE